MDLNQILSRHQIALINADRSSADNHQNDFFALARFYGQRIGKLRAQLGVHQYRSTRDALPGLHAGLSAGLGECA